MQSIYRQMVTTLHNKVLSKPAFAIRRSLLSSQSTTTTNDGIDNIPHKIDNYGGLHFDISNLNIESNRLLTLVKNTQLENAQKARTVWVKLAQQHYRHLDTLTQEGFQVHHAQNGVLHLFKALEEVCRVPSYAHTNIGVGAVVVNSRDEILFVKEKHPYKRQLWKFPGGYVEKGEDLHNAAMREVREETGITTEFVSLLLMRHIHKFTFDCSDMYFVCLLRATSDDIHKCSNEIAFCEWSPIDQIIDELSPFNRLCVEKYLKFKENPRVVDPRPFDTPYLPIPTVTIYSPN